MYVSEYEDCKQCVCMLYVELGTFLGCFLIHNSAAVLYQENKQGLCRASM